VEKKKYIEMFSSFTEPFNFVPEELTTSTVDTHKTDPHFLQVQQYRKRQKLTALLTICKLQ